LIVGRWSLIVGRWSLIVGRGVCYFNEYSLM